MNHPIPIEVSLNDGHSSQHLPKSLDRLNILYWGEKFTADKSRVKLLDFAVEGKLLSTITKQITSPINLNSTKKNHKIKITNPRHGIQYLFKCLHFVCPSVHQWWHTSPTPSQEAWLKLLHFTVEVLLSTITKPKLKITKTQNDKKKFTHTCRPIPILGQVSPNFFSLRCIKDRHSPQHLHKSSII